MGFRSILTKKYGLLTQLELILLGCMMTFSLLSLIILYHTFTPVLNGPNDWGKEYSFITHTISKLGRLENQPSGAWILWCLTMMCFGTCLIFIIQKFANYMEYIRPKKSIKRVEWSLRKLGVLCFDIGSLAVILVGFFPLSSSNGINTFKPHQFIVCFMGFLVIGWLLLAIPVMNITRTLNKGKLFINIHYLSGLILIGFAIYWLFSIPVRTINPDEVYLLWGFWSFILAEWLTLLELLIFGITILWFLISTRKGI